MKITPNISDSAADANTLGEARRRVAAGLSIIPILADGSKAPPVEWKRFQQRRPSDTELIQWFKHQPFGLAIVCGSLSGGREVLDFDAPETFGPWDELVQALLGSLLDDLVIVQPPTGGRHVYLRCEVINANQKLAQDLKAETLIETRGEGGYSIIPPSPPSCHPLHKPYIPLQGDLANISTMTP